MNTTEEILRLRCVNSAIFEKENHRDFLYKVYLKNGNSYSITTILPLNFRPTPSNIVSDSSRSYVNGFKVVLMNNGEYAYMREADQKLLPYRYDFASDFNEKGYAMVAKDGTVSWINKTFKYLSVDGIMVEDYINNPNAVFKGVSEIYNFNNGEIPLSKICIGNKVSYFGLNGKLKEFYMFDGKIQDYSCTSFNDGKTFDSNGIAVDYEKILFASGYFCSLPDFIKICAQDGTFLKLSETIKRLESSYRIRK